MEGLRPREAVHLEDPDLEVPARAQRRVVEGRAAVSLAEPDVLVHPDRLAVTSADGDHLRVCCHEEFGAVSDPFLALPIGSRCTTHPGVLCALRIKAKEECLSGAEVSLSVAALVLLVALEPSRRTIRTEYLIITCLDHEQCWFMMFHPHVEGG